MNRYSTSVKAFLLACFVVLVTVASFAQSGQKWATGGNSGSNGDFLGTTNNYPLVFKVNNSEYLRITPNGYVGISNTNPLYKLDISGRLHITGTFIADSNVNARSFYASQSVNGSSLVITNNGSFGSLSVSGASSFTGQVNAGNVIITGTVGNGTLSTSVSEIKNHISDAAIHRSINDNGTGTTDLWSANKILTEISNVAVSNPVISGHINNQAIHRSINDNGTGTTDLWSASKIISQIAQAAHTDTLTIKALLVNYLRVADSVSIGGSVTIGSRSGVVGLNSVAIGGTAPAYGYLNNPEASGWLSFAIGPSVKATGIGCISMGGGNISSGTLSIAFGADNNANGNFSLALGNKNNSSGENAISIGFANRSSGQRSLATGNSTIASGQTASTMGYLTMATGNCSHAGGSGKITGTDTLRVTASGYNSFNFSQVGFGYNGTGAAANNSAILGGTNNTIENGADRSAILGGQNNIIKPAAYNSVILGGDGLTATNANTVYALNLSLNGDIKVSNKITDGTYSTNVKELRLHIDNPDIHHKINDNGTSTNDIWSASKIISEIADASGFDTLKVKTLLTNYLRVADSVTIGGSVTIGARSGVVGLNSVAMGGSAPQYGFPDNPEASEWLSFAIGASVKATGIGSISMGAGNNSSGQFSVTFGVFNVASSNNSIAIGSRNKATEKQSIAIGLDNIASGTRSLATGDKTIASGNTASTTGYLTEASGSFARAGGCGTINGTDTMRVTASGFTSFNFSQIWNDYTGTGAASNNSAILGGVNNSIESSADNSSIIGGYNNTIKTNARGAVILGGENITATLPYTVYAQNILAKGDVEVHGTITTNALLITDKITVDTVSSKKGNFDSLNVKKSFQTVAVSADTLHALQSLQINHSLIIGKDTVTGVSTIATKQDSALYIQSNAGLDSTQSTIINANNAARVGIGTTTPSEKLTVAGNAKIIGNTYVTGTVVAGGVIISDKVSSDTLISKSAKFDSLIVAQKMTVQAIEAEKLTAKTSVEAKSLQTKADSALYIQSTATTDSARSTIINAGNPGMVGIGTTNPTEKLTVVGNAKFTGNITFGNNKTIGYTPATGGNPEFINIGGQTPVTPIGLPCFLPTANVPIINQFSYMIQSCGTANGSHTNIMSMGFDGANGIIDLAGTNDDGTAPRLLINYYCGKDILMNTGPTGGNVFMCTPTTGFVGIGTSNPQSKLEVIGMGNTSTTSSLNVTDNNNKSLLFVRDDGQIGIGTTNPGSYKLAVEGKIAAREFVATLATPFPDYVFDNNYDLMPLTKLENYIQLNKHLPDVPSATEIAKDGLSLGEMNSTLLKKVEELTLYVIEQNKKIEELQKDIIALQKK